MNVSFIMEFLEQINELNCKWNYTLDWKVKFVPFQYIFNAESKFFLDNIRLALNQPLRVNFWKSRNVFIAHMFHYEKFILIHFFFINSYVVGKWIPAVFQGMFLSVNNLTVTEAMWNPVCTVFSKHFDKLLRTRIWWSN
jgi:hypothetical protein